MLATDLGRYGACIIVNDITPERAETAVMKLQQEGIKAIAAPFNVTHKQDIETAVEHIEKDIGAIDVLINNAGIRRRHPFTEFPEQEWRRHRRKSNCGFSRLSSRHAPYDGASGRKSNQHLFSEEEMPPFWNSIFAAVIPVILMAIAAVCEITLPKTNAIRVFFEFIGNPAVALFIAIIIAIFTLGRRNGRTVEQVMDIVGESIGAIAMILFIIPGGGAFKQVLVDSGVGQYISQLMTGTSHLLY